MKITHCPFCIKKLSKLAEKSYSKDDFECEECKIESSPYVRSRTHFYADTEHLWLSFEQEDVCIYFTKNFTQYNIITGIYDDWWVEDIKYSVNINITQDNILEVCQNIIKKINRLKVLK